MKVFILIISILFLQFTLSFAVEPTKNYSKTSKKFTSSHPKLSEQEKLIDCADCHKNSTPKIHNEWYESTHGISNVKCYLCHGTFENMKKIPDLSNCAVCHKGAFEHSGGKKCWECHKAHGFKADKK
jgi:hypothetical protein